MGSHSVACHPTQVNVPHLNPSQAGWYSIYLLPRRDGRLTGSADVTKIQLDARRKMVLYVPKKTRTNEMHIHTSMGTLSRGYQAT